MLSSACPPAPPTARPVGVGAPTPAALPPAADPTGLAGSVSTFRRPSKSRVRRSRSHAVSTVSKVAASTCGGGGGGGGGDPTSPSQRSRTGVDIETNCFEAKKLLVVVVVVVVSLDYV